MRVQQADSSSIRPEFGIGNRIVRMERVHPEEEFVEGDCLVPARYREVFE